MKIVPESLDTYTYTPVNLGNEGRFHYSGTVVLQDYFYWSVNRQLKIFGEEPKAPKWKRALYHILHYHFEVMQRFWKA